MKTKNMKALLSATAVAAALVACFGLAACGSSAASSSASASSASASASSAAASSEAADSSAAASESASSAAAGAVGEEAGFEETPIFEDVEAGGWLNVSAVYFQPVPMTDGSTIEGKDIHLEADIHALANNFGFGVGDWVPYLTVEYKVTKEGADKPTAEGTFMEMSASDGPHYGANIAMPDGQGKYNLEVTIKSPADNNYLLHTDAETGPGAKSFDDGVDWPLVVSESWDYVPLEY